MDWPFGKIYTEEELKSMEDRLINLLKTTKKGAENGCKKKKSSNDLRKKKLENL